jgi:glycosyltransferase involved in cell wall biosynthesis
LRVKPGQFVSKHVLFYYPANRRSVALETLLVAVQGLGHKVTCLTTAPRGVLHEELERHGIACHEHVLPDAHGPRYYLAQARYLARFCRQHAIDTVWSHLQHANLIAVLAQYLMKSRVVAFRHHNQFNMVAEQVVSRNEVIVDTIINKLAKAILVPSQGVRETMRRFESVDIAKVVVAPYLYDFSKYKQPDPARVREIEAEFPCHLRLIMVSRLVAGKGHDVVFPVFKKLVAEGLDLKVLVMDEGDEKARLQSWVAQNGLGDRVFFLGFRSNIVDYLGAAELLIHPSVAEASNSAVKELGLMHRTAAVHQGVGDFDAYVVDGESGFLVPIEAPPPASRPPFAGPTPTSRSWGAWATSCTTT